MSSTIEEILILSIMLPLSWFFYLFTRWFVTFACQIIDILVQWPYL